MQKASIAGAGDLLRIVVVGTRCIDTQLHADAVMGSGATVVAAGALDTDVKGRKRANAPDLLFFRCLALRFA